MNKNRVDLNDPYTARVGDSPLQRRALGCRKHLNNPQTARLGDFSLFCAKPERIVSRIEIFGSIKMTLSTQAGSHDPALPLP